MTIENSILPANLEWLKKRFLAPHKDVAIDNDLFQNLDYSDGQLSVKFEGKHTLWSSPSKEATLENIKSIIPIGPMEYIYVFGFDDGQYLRQIIKNLPKSSILVCLEPFPESFFKLCETINFTDLLSHERFHFLLGNSPEQAKIDKVGALVAELESCKEFQRPHPWIPNFLDATPLKKKLQASMLNALKMKHAIKNTTDISCGYSLSNTAYSLKCGDANHLKQAIEGKPYIVVGMGPSLSMQIETLKKVQGKAFIAATDNSLKELLLQGIDPDIVFHVEWRDESKEFYKGIQLRKDTVLCYAHGTNTAILKLWPSFKVAYPSDHVEFIFSEITKSKGWQPNIGATVGDFALHFGVQCKASEIYLVGIDACCPTGSYCHPNNSSIREVYQETNRFWSPERWDWGYVTSWPDRLELEGWDGKPVHSIGSFKRTLEVIDTLNQLLTEDQKLYSTSQYGAKFNAESTTLDTLCTHPDLDKTLTPSQSCVSPQEAISVINLRRKQVKDYYRRLKQFTIYLDTYINGYENKAINLAAMEKNYLNEHKNFQAQHDKFAWIENMLIVLDNSLAIRSTRDQRKRSDADDDVAVYFSAKNFSDYIRKITPFEQVLINHLNATETAFINE